MTPPDADALTRLYAIAGCGKDTGGRRVNGEPITHRRAIIWAKSDMDECSACASLLVTAIAAPERERVERDTIERCADECVSESERWEGDGEPLEPFGRLCAARLRALPPRYGENPKEGL